MFYSKTFKETLNACIRFKLNLKVVCVDRKHIITLERIIIECKVAVVVISDFDHAIVNAANSFCNYDDRTNKWKVFITTFGNISYSHIVEILNENKHTEYDNITCKNLLEKV